MRVGDPLDKAPRWARRSPAARWSAFSATSSRVSEEGAALLRRRARYRGRNSKGFFVKPTVFSEVKPHMKIAQEEIFGPVLSRSASRIPTKPWPSRTARSTAWCRRSGRRTSSWRIAWPGEIKAGSVWINTYNGFDTGSPFGGYKQSGFGRDLGAHALEQYTNVKSVWVAL